MRLNRTNLVLFAGSGLSLLTVLAAAFRWWEVALSGLALVNLAVLAMVLLRGSRSPRGDAGGVAAVDARLEVLGVQLHATLADTRAEVLALREELALRRETDAGAGHDVPSSAT